MQRQIFILQLHYYNSTGNLQYVRISYTITNELMYRKHRKFNVYRRQ
jgi:hypothetical protein